MSFQKKSTKLLTAVFLIYALLVATHKGEFWPLSIYPMFSTAGQPWTRALVRDISDPPQNQQWDSTAFDHLPGKAVVLRDYGVDQIDFANFVSKTKDWDLRRRNALIKMFGPKNLQSRKFMVMKVHGALVGEDSVVVRAIPMMMVTADTVFANPNIISNSNAK